MVCQEYGSKSINICWEELPQLIIPQQIFFDLSALRSALLEEGFQRKIIEGYFKIFKDLFPGIDECIQDIEFVRELKNYIIQKIVANIRIKIQNSDRKVESKRLEQFLYFTHNVLLQYAEAIEKTMAVEKGVDQLEKLENGYIGIILTMVHAKISNSSRAEILGFVKYVDQWFFIEETSRFTTVGVHHHSILKKARGKFLPWSDAESW